MSEQVYAEFGSEFVGSKSVRMPRMEQMQGICGLTIRRIRPIRRILQTHLPGPSRPARSPRCRQTHDLGLPTLPHARGQTSARSITFPVAPDPLPTVEGRLVEPDYPAAFAYLAARSRKRAFTVVFTDVIDRTASEALLAQAGALRPRHLPLAVAIRDPALERLVLDRPADVEAAFRRAAAEELLLARAEALAEMRRLGVLVVDVAPGSAAREVVAQYERLKRTGRI